MVLIRATWGCFLGANSCQKNLLRRPTPVLISTHTLLRTWTRHSILAIFTFWRDARSLRNRLFSEQAFSSNPMTSPLQFRNHMPSTLHSRNTLPIIDGDDREMPTEGASLPMHGSHQLGSRLIGKLVARTVVVLSGEFIRGTTTFNLLQSLCTPVSTSWEHRIPGPEKKFVSMARHNDGSCSSLPKDYYHRWWYNGNRSLTC